MSMELTHQPKVLYVLHKINALHSARIKRKPKGLNYHSPTCLQNTKSMFNEETSWVMKFVSPYQAEHPVRTGEYPPSFPSDWTLTWSTLIDMSVYLTLSNLDGRISKPKIAYENFGCTSPLSQFSCQ